MRGTGIFGRRGTVKEIATSQGSGSQKVRQGTTTKEVGSQKKGSEKREGTAKGGTKGLRGTFQLLFGSRESKPARELPRDENVVFVAGATGKVGSRVVRFVSSHSSHHSLILKISKRHHYTYLMGVPGVCIPNRQCIKRKMHKPGIL